MVIVVYGTYRAIWYNRSLQRADSRQQSKDSVKSHLTMVDTVYRIRESVVARSVSK